MTDPVETTTAVFRIVIAGSMERIFDELTKRHEPQGAVFNARMHVSALSPGGKFQMRTASGRHTLVIGEVLEVDPPRRFVHTHRFTQYDDPFSKVIYELKPVVGGVEVTLTVQDLPVGTRTAKDMMVGGDMILGSLKSIVETGRPKFATRLLYGIFGLMEAMLPKRTRSEHWPISGQPDQPQSSDPSEGLPK